MDSSLSYLALNRQIGLAREMDAIANNVANLATTGFRREGLVFAEFVQAAAPGDSVSMADLRGRFVSDRPGELTITGGRLDIAIAGEGFFTILSGGETLLTRAGAFQRSAEGLLVTPDGAPVLDDGAAPIFVPPESASLEVYPRFNSITVARSNWWLMRNCKDGQFTADDAEKRCLTRIT